MSWNSFLESAVTRAASVTGISLAERSVGIDPERVIKVPRFPKALVHDLGGSIDPFSGHIYERTFGVSIVVFVPRGASGSEAARKLATLAELMTTEFTHTRDNSSIRCLGETEESAEAAGQGEIYIKTLVFSYDILDA